MIIKIKDRIVNYLSKKPNTDLEKGDHHEKHYQIYYHNINDSYNVFDSDCAVIFLNEFLDSPQCLYEFQQSDN